MAGQIPILDNAARINAERGIKIIDEKDLAEQCQDTELILGDKLIELLQEFRTVLQNRPARMPMLPLEKKIAVILGSIPKDNRMLFRVIRTELQQMVAYYCTTRSRQQRLPQLTPISSIPTPSMVYHRERIIGECLGRIVQAKIDGVERSDFVQWCHLISQAHFHGASSEEILAAKSGSTVSEIYN